MRQVLSLMILVAAAAGAQSTSSKLVAEAAELYWQMLLQDPGLRLREGLAVTTLPDVTYQHAAASAMEARKMLERLNAVKPSEITHDEDITVEELRWEMNRIISDEKYFWLKQTQVVTPYRSPIPEANRVLATWKFKSANDVDGYLSLLAKYPVFVQSIRGVLETQLGKGIVLPKAEVAQVDGFLSAYIKPADKSVFYVGRERLTALAPEAADRVQASVARMIGASVNPALNDLLTFVRGPYLAKAPDAVGESQYPDGKEYYRYLVRYYTTMDVTPEEVHQKGLEEVARINQRMAEARKSLGFTGTKAEFQEALKKDPRFFAKTPDEVQERLMAFVHLMEPKIDSNFRIKPKAPYGVKRLDPALEAGQTFGHYETPSAMDPKGYYFFNGSDLEHRSWANGEGLMYHELIPGHHFQLSLMLENDKLPQFRRNAFYGANSEGWGEYASMLGEEMGLYQDPYNRYGRYAMEMFLTVRLVVDTGMNYFGWSRERATEYMRENILESDGQIATETLRYSTDMPGQALGYKMGAIKIKELREKARAALGDQFDIRDYHDWFLTAGSMPMTVLEKHVDYEIAQALVQSKAN
jgi:uncharacterized protein (DUF885 family)